MANRQKLYIGLAVSAALCTGVGLYLFYRHRRRIGLSRNFRSKPPIAQLPTPKRPNEYQPIDRDSFTSSDNDYVDSEASHPQNGTLIPDGGVPLTPDQAAILTRLLYESDDDEHQLHHVLTSIANASAFRESQINLASVECISRLAEILHLSDNPTTKSKVLLALNNFALNEFAINQFRGIVGTVIDLCRTNPVQSWLRSCGLNLLINMSVLIHLHDEYISKIEDLGDLIQTTLLYDDEALSSGKILVNLSKNRTNVESLIELNGLGMRTIIERFESEEILQRYFTFYNNLGESIIYRYSQCGDSNNNRPGLKDPKFQRHDAIYFEFFDQDKQSGNVDLLRSWNCSGQIRILAKRLIETIERIRQHQQHLMNSSIETTILNSS